MRSIFQSDQIYKATLLRKRRRPLADKRLLEPLGNTQHTVRERELDVLLHDLLDVRPANVRRLDLGNTDNLDRAEASTVTGSHVEVLIQQ